MEAVFAWVATYGYAALFTLLMLGIVGLPVPDETLLVFTGALVAQGKLDPYAALITAVAGSWCGMTASYWIGRTLGFGVTRRFGKYFHLDDAKLEKVHQWFHRAGHWALFFGYYIAGVRHFTAIIAGASLLEFGIFARYAFPGGLVWAGGFLSLGYYIGTDWRRIMGLIHEYMHWISYALVAGVAIYLLIRWRMKEKKMKNKTQ